MSDKITQSRFFMWRTLFALAHADGIVTDEEIAFMAHILEDIDFTNAQTAILKDDIVNPKNVEEMFKSITSKEDRLKFFEFARDLVWVDGDYASDEQEVMIKLLEEHVKDTDIEELVGNVSLELERDYSINKNNSGNDSFKSDKKRKSGRIIDVIKSFRSSFS